MKGSHSPVPYRVAVGAFLLLLALPLGAGDAASPAGGQPAAPGAGRLETTGDPEEVRSLTERLSAVEARLEAEREQRRVELLKRDQEIRALRARHRKLWAGAVATALLLLAAAAVLLLARNRVNEWANAEMSVAYSRMEEQARSDSLTSLANRREATERLQEEVRRTARTHRPLSLVMLDVDGLRKINEERGQVCGDAVLKGLGVFLRSMLRELDIAARWGGGEFLLVLPETSLEGALLVAERVRRGAEEIRVHDDGSQVSFTVTIGAGTVQEHLPADECIRRAEEAMREGKRSGRNRVVAG